MPTVNLLRIAHFMPYTGANGPGTRTGIWFQGCSMRCPGCTNVSMQPQEGGESVTVLELVERVWHTGTDAVTLSGGEPLEQPFSALMHFLRHLRMHKMSVVLFTGRETVPPPVASLIDAAIVGPYRQHLPRRGLCGSSNQRVVLFTKRYTQADFAALPPIEITISPSRVVVTGISGAKYAPQGGNP